MDITQPLLGPEQDLTVTLVQQPLQWLDPEANRRHFAAQLAAANLQQTDLLVLPEVFSTGFHAKARDLAEPADGVTYQWMREQARRYQLVITGSLFIRRGEEVVNRLLWVTPDSPADGRCQYYDKRHLFRMGGEHKHFQAGQDRKIVELKGWRVCLQVCYDLRFPVWARNRNDYDLLLYVANWPALRAEHWRCLLQARAIENLSALVAVNRLGLDGKGLEYSGDSVIRDAQGEALVQPAAAAGCFTGCLSADKLRAYRQKFPAYLDADEFDLSAS